MGIVAVVLAAAVIVGWFLKKGVARKEKDRVLYSLYMNLFELYGYYYWLVANGEKIKPQIDEKIQKLVWMIKTDLRKAYRMKLLEEIEKFISEEKGYYHDTASRYRALEKILSKLEEYLEAHYPDTAEKIERQKSKPQGSDDICNAPGFIDWKPPRKR